MRGNQPYQYRIYVTRLAKFANCEELGINTTADGLANTECANCGAIFKQEEHWRESSGPGSLCPYYKDNILEYEDQDGTPVAVCPEPTCLFEEELQRSLILVSDWSTKEDNEDYDDDWMIDRSFNATPEEGEDDTTDLRPAPQDIANDPLFNDILMLPIQPANEPCNCGIGRKYRLCHGA